MLKTLLILLFIYFLFKLVVKVILPYVLKSYIQKKQQEFQNRYSDENKKSVGEITIEYNKDKKNKNTSGEYVDYEEIK